jgi:hypothetical protein
MIAVHLLRWGDWIRYTRAFGWYHEGDQPEENGPYVGGIVGFEDDGLGGTLTQVRADGWMGVAPIYAVAASDIIWVESKCNQPIGGQSKHHQTENVSA